MPRNRNRWVPYTRTDKNTGGHEPRTAPAGEWPQRTRRRRLDRRKPQRASKTRALHKPRGWMLDGVAIERSNYDGRRLEGPLKPWKRKKPAAPRPRKPRVAKPGPKLTRRQAKKNAMAVARITTGRQWVKLRKRLRREQAAVEQAMARERQKGAA